MRHDPIEPRAPKPQPFDLSAFARDVVLQGILAAADDKSIMKERVMLARECGFLSDDETREWVVRHGLKHA